MKPLCMAMAVTLCITGLMTGASYAQGPDYDKNRLWYKEPAQNWNEALPVGNGRLGAMVFGHPARERIQLNEDTFWSGRPHDYTNPETLAHLKQVRTLIFNEQFAEADQLVQAHLLGVPMCMQAYQTLGDLSLSFPGQGEVTQYTRELDMDEAVTRVRYERDGVIFVREIFSSSPDQAIVIRLLCNTAGAINTDVALDSPHKHDVTATDPGMLVMQGRWVGDGKDRSLIAGVEGPGMTFEARLRVESEGGRVSAEQGVLKIRNTNAVTIRVVAATSFIDYTNISGDPAQRCDEYMKMSQGKTYAQIRSRHISDYQRLFNRVKLDLGHVTASQRRTPTNERLANYKKGIIDPGLEALYFQFGRYLMISGSRPG
ncbi:MAG: glycoside hydrolase family 95 protein, partial [Phycisphaeraceae bacterium]|nr:glycoside hydrolase family 95 protein [Phycisphaeraceae bacterium]